MFGSLIQRFVQTAYIAVVKDGNTCDVYVKTMKRKKELSHESKRFFIDTKETAQLLYDFLEAAHAKNAITYLATIINSINQGGVAGCDRQSFKKFQIDTTNASVVPIDKQWSVFASNYDLRTTQDDYQDVGEVDFIFSTLICLQRCFSEKMKNTVVACILKQKTSATLGIFSNGNLLYGNYIVLQLEQPPSPEQDKDSTIFGDDADFEENNLVDLDDIALELKEPEEDEISEDTMQNPQNAASEIETLGNDLRIVEFVKTCLTQYYKSDVYEARFIDSLLIADPYFESADIKSILENELLLPTEHIQIDLAEIVCNLAVEEALS